MGVRSCRFWVPTVVFTERSLRTVSQEQRVSAGFSIDFKELVRSRADLVELVGESVTLTPRRGGREYVGLCPFHDDHNPSLTINQERQSYRCWVCDEGGDCFSWVMKHDGVDFREALEILARRANLEIPKSERRRGSESGQGKPQLYDVLSWAENEFHRCLLHSPEAKRARDYLEKRGFTAETLAKFRVGYHPNEWEWLIGRSRGKFSLEQLLEARLVGKKEETGRTYDYFVDRVMFPIRDERSRPVAFGGRVLPDDPKPDAAKYWNSPESALFTKSRLLYGFDVARDAVRRSGTAVVMEGYTDCMMAHQAGLSNTVCTLGTALTETHVIALKRFARKVVLVYDGDEAGRAAAERALLRFLPQEIDLQILTLPGGLDPAEFLEEYGVEALREQVEQAVEAWNYKLSLTIEKYGLKSIDARERAVDEIVEFLSHVSGFSQCKRKDSILSELARKTLVKEQTVRQRLIEARRKHSRRGAGGPEKTIRIDAEPCSEAGPTDSSKANKNDLLELELLEIIFIAPENIDAIRREVGLDEFRNLRLRQLLDVCYRLAEQGIRPTSERVIVELEDPELKRQAVRIDASAREKDVSGKLEDSDRHGTASQREAGEESFLQRAIENLIWRGEEASHERTKGQLAERSEASNGPDSSDKELLRLISEFHRKRATKKSPT